MKFIVLLGVSWKDKNFYFSNDNSFFTINYLEIENFEVSKVRVELFNFLALCTKNTKPMLMGLEDLDGILINQYL